MIPYFVAKYVLIVGVSATILVLSLTLDLLFSPLLPVVKFLIQIPVLVILVEYFRSSTIQHMSEQDVGAAFFFAAPLATFGATRLFADIGDLLGM